MSSRLAPWALAALLLASVASVAPPAAAHCDPGTQGRILNLVSTCEHNQTLEDAIDAANLASDGSVAFVLAKNLRFHPEEVRVKPGGTVWFVYADADRNDQHDPRNTGPCIDPAVDPLATPKLCVPKEGLGSTAGACFDVFPDQGGFLTFNGQNYPVTLSWSGTRVLKSHGVMSGTPVGDLTGAKPFSTCLPGAGTMRPDGDVVIPYHCGIHGLASTPEKLMRAVIVLEA